MTGLREHEPARLVEPSQMHAIIDDRMTLCHKAVSIAKNRPEAKLSLAVWRIRA